MREVVESFFYWEGASSTRRFEPDMCSLDKPGQQVKWSREGHNFYGLAAALVFSLLQRESDLPT